MKLFEKMKIFNFILKTLKNKKILNGIKDKNKFGNKV